MASSAVVNATLYAGLSLITVLPTSSGPPTCEPSPEEHITCSAEAVAQAFAGNTSGWVLHFNGSYHFNGSRPGDIDLIPPTQCIAGLIVEGNRHAHTIIAPLTSCIRILWIYATPNVRTLHTGLLIEGSPWHHTLVPPGKTSLHVRNPSGGAPIPSNLRVPGGSTTFDGATAAPDDVQVSVQSANESAPEWLAQYAASLGVPLILSTAGTATLPYPVYIYTESIRLGPMMICPLMQQLSLHGNIIVGPGELAFVPPASLSDAQDTWPIWYFDNEGPSPGTKPCATSPGTAATAWASYGSFESGFPSDGSAIGTEYIDPTVATAFDYVPDQIAWRRATAVVPVPASETLRNMDRVEFQGCTTPKGCTIAQSGLQTLSQEITAINAGASSSAAGIPNSVFTWLVPDSTTALLELYGLCLLYNSTIENAIGLLSTSISEKGAGASGKLPPTENQLATIAYMWPHERFQLPWYPTQITAPVFSNQNCIDFTKHVTTGGGSLFAPSMVAPIGAVLPQSDNHKNDFVWLPLPPNVSAPESHANRRASLFTYKCILFDMCTPEPTAIVQRNGVGASALSSPDVQLEENPLLVFAFNGGVYGPASLVPHTEDDTEELCTIVSCPLIQNWYGAKATTFDHYTVDLSTPTFGYPTRVLLTLAAATQPECFDTHCDTTYDKLCFAAHYTGGQCTIYTHLNAANLKKQGTSSGSTVYIRGLALPELVNITHDSAAAACFASVNTAQNSGKNCTSADAHCPSNHFYNVDPTTQTFECIAITEECYPNGTLIINPEGGLTGAAQQCAPVTAFLNTSEESLISALLSDVDLGPQIVGNVSEVNAAVLTVRMPQALECTPTTQYYDSTSKTCRPVTLPVGAQAISVPATPSSDAVVCDLQPCAALDVNEAHLQTQNNCTRPCATLETCSLEEGVFFALTPQPSPTGGGYANHAQCEPVAQCKLFEVEVQAPTPTSDRKCRSVLKRSEGVSEQAVSWTQTGLSWALAAGLLAGLYTK